MKIEWSIGARNELHATYRFIARDSEARAADFCGRLIAGTTHLAEFPYSGALVPEDGAYRQVVVHGYRVMYAITDSGVRITAVVAPRREGATIWTDRRAESK